MKMEFGICLPTKANSWEVVKRAEEFGFTYAWFYDTHLLSADVLVAMGAAAVKTSRIKLCAGVFIPSNRIAPVAANALATLNALAPGRIVFGVSTGFTGRRTMGLGPVPLARMEKYIEVVEGLLKGQTVEWSEEGGTHKVRFLNPELGLINIKDPIPTFISAFGPKARALTAKLGAGWIGNVSYPQREQADIDHIRAAWQQNGRNLSDFYAAASTGGCVLDEGEPADSKRAMAQAAPFAAIVFHNLVEVDQFGSVVPLEGPFPFEAELGAYRKVYQQYEPADARYLSNHRGHLMFVRPEEKHLSSNVVRGLSFTGTRTELVERARGMEAIGYKQIAVNIVPGQEEDMLQRLSEVAAKV
jgi:5,10-methylenetetrahydromethanopterin reductase